MKFIQKCWRIKFPNSNEFVICTEKSETVWFLNFLYDKQLLRTEAFLKIKL
jgi:hypothetical protein